LDFLRTFIACRGNLKEIESALGISYPTVRGRLDQLIESLGMLSIVDSSHLDPEEKSEILAALERGDLTVAEAEERLRA
jgi:hypothetical protein